LARRSLDREVLLFERRQVRRLQLATSVWGRGKKKSVGSILTFRNQKGLVLRRHIDLRETRELGRNWPEEKRSRRSGKQSR